MIAYDDIQSVHIEISSHCNAACPSCPRNYHGGHAYPWFEKKFLTLTDHQNFFTEEFVKRQKLIVYCGNYGDPTLAPELIDVCRWWLSINPDLAIQINSNAGTRDRAFWHDLGQLLKGTTGNVTFSVDGLADTNHLYRRNVDWGKVRTAMDAYLSAGGPGVWEFLVFEHNQHQIAEARELAKNLGFKEFHPKKAMGFWTQGAMPVLKRDGGLDYYIFPPTEESFRNRAAVKKDDSHLPVPDQDVMTRLSSNAVDLRTFPFDPQIEQRFNCSSISCQTIMGGQIFVSADGLVYPCCFIGSRQYAPNTYNFINTQIQQFLASSDKDNYSLRHHPLKRIVEHPFFSKAFSESWLKPSVRDGKLAICAEFCGTGVTEYKEATSHRARLGKEA